MSSRAADGLLSIAMTEMSEFTVQERLDALQHLDAEGLLCFLQEFDWMKNPALFAKAFKRYPNPDSLPKSVQDKWQELRAAEYHAVAYYNHPASR